MKKYPQQVGPNLAMWNIKCAADAMLTHQGGCSGVLIQNLGKDVFRASQLPDHSPGKIFCQECGHGVGKAASRAIRGERGTEEFYFPNKEDYEIRANTYLDSGYTYRYWEWKVKKLAIDSANELLDSIIGRDRSPGRGKIKKLFPNKYIKARPLKRTVTCTSQQGDDWVISHPKVVIRLPRVEFSLTDANKIEKRIGSFECRNYDRDELIAEAMRVIPGQHKVTKSKDPFGRNDTLTKNSKFIYKSNRGLVVFDQNHWDATSFRMIREELRVIKFPEIRDLRIWLEDKVDQYAIAQDSVKVFPSIRVGEACDYMFQPSLTAR